MQGELPSEVSVSCSSFSTPRGLSEIYIAITGKDGISFEETLKDIKEAYSLTLNDYALNTDTLQFTRVYVGDAANENILFQESELYELLKSGAVSVVQQSPLCGSVSIIAYHIKDDTGKLRTSGPVVNKDNSFQSIYSTGRFYTLLWTAHSTGDGKDSYKQTENIFTALSSTYRKYNMNLRNNTVRTWIYVRDIDNNYKGMIDARRDLFSRIGLTDRTRYIASTGIEGKVAGLGSLVSIDSLSIGNLKEEQIVRMEASNHLSSTILYGVTFERGVRIRFGDRSHLHISGTASINDKGTILYPGDIRGQTERTIDNIEALLKPHGATLEDMHYIFLYVRNRKNYQFIQDILESRIPYSVPLIPLEGAVCRPGWLIEIEGVAIIEDSSIYPPFF